MFKSLFKFFRRRRDPLERALAAPEVKMRFSSRPGFTITGYYTPSEIDYIQADFLEVQVWDDRGGSETVRFPSAFLDAVRMEGWALTLNGWYVGYYGRKYHRSAVPLNSRGKALDIGQVAVDPAYIPKGATVKLSGYSPGNNKTFNDLISRELLATDVGSMIKSRHIDVYTGEGTAARDVAYMITRNNGSTVRVESTEWGSALKGA